MKALVNFLNSHDGYQLEKIQAQIYSIQDKFIKVYPSLIPAICLQYIGEDNFDYEKVGSSTSTFDSIKEFYIDVYETLCNLLIIPVAFDNIKDRKSNTFDSGERSVFYITRDKKAAVAQFSFLMVLAPILGETLLEAVSGDLTAGVAAGPLAAGFLASFVTGCLACKFMIEIVKRGKLIWFALYCAAAGLVSILSYFC